MTGVIARRRISLGLLSAQNASLFRLARRSIRRDAKRSLAVFVLVGAPVGLLTALVFGAMFQVSLFDDWFTDEFTLFAGSLLPLVVGTVVVAAFVASVRRRTRELGQLVVVGADGAQLRRLVLIEAAALVVPGVVVFSLLGMAAVFALQPNDESLASILGGGRGALLLIPLLFGLIVALAAALVPAGRAASVSPIAALNARVPERRLRWWPVLLAVVALVAVGVWRTRIAPWEDATIFYWGVAIVWAGFAVLATLVPRVVRRIADQADHLPGVARLVVRDAGRSVARSSSLAVVAVAVSLLGVMAVAGLESDRGVYDVMDARLVTAPFEDRAAADAAVADLGAVAAVVDFEDLRQLDRESPGYGPTFVAALTDDAIVAFGLTDEVLASMPDGGAIVLDGESWPLIGPDGSEIPAMVVDAGVGWQSGGGRDLPVALMRSTDLAGLPLFPGSDQMSAEDIAEQAAMFDPAVRLYVLEEPLAGGVLEGIWSGRATLATPLGIAGMDDRYFGLDLDGFLRVLLAVGLGVIVVAAVGLTKLGAGEVDAQLRPMLEMGAAPSIRRKFVALQAGVLVLVGGVLGSGLGVALFWVVTRGDRSVPDPIVPWSAMLTFSLGAALLAAGVVATLFGQKPPRSAEFHPQK